MSVSTSGGPGHDRGMPDDDSWYWCFTHDRPEHGNVCRAMDRFGPYPSEHAAREWKESRDAREEKWEAEDERWEAWPDDKPDDTP
jgi:hypothetical protein